MKQYIGIDLGTTNSAICSYDGENLHLYKSPDQTSVTPSAIHVGPRGNKIYGIRAYHQAAFDSENTAWLFKRFMGTSTPQVIRGQKLMPEECSAEIISVLLGYVPADIRNGKETGTVVTVPAAFNQMQRDATMSAARLAGIERVALMQEPVAAVMSVMRTNRSDGTFLIYDLGGGTFDIALAQSTSGRVSLLTHGGIVQCGGRDFDNLLVESVVLPWLQVTFHLPKDLLSDGQYKKLIRLAAYASEMAKIELSSKKSAMIALPENEINMKDLDGRDIYFEIPINCDAFDQLIRARLRKTVDCTRELLVAAHHVAGDVQRIVFIGGPTQYQPLREYVSSELGLRGDTTVDAMTAVAEGAAIFAESIDWTSENRGRKSTVGSIKSQKLNVAFAYQERTTELKAKLLVKCSEAVPLGSTFQVDSPDTGWTSGRVALVNGAGVELGLNKNGENRFKIFLFNANGSPIQLDEDVIIITRTNAVIDAIPSSHSIGVAVRKSMNSTAIETRFIVQKGESLPKKGFMIFKAIESLKAGSNNALIFAIREGENDNPRDNFSVGDFRISGNDFEVGIIAPGDEIRCEYEVDDSGRLSILLKVDKVAFNSGKRDFYTRSGPIDYSDATAFVQDEIEVQLERVDATTQQEQLDAPKLEEARKILQDAQVLTERHNDPEACKQAWENVGEVKNLLAKYRKENLASLRTADLIRKTNTFNGSIRKHARPAEITSFERMAKVAQTLIERNDAGFEHHLEIMQDMIQGILQRQDWFVVDVFRIWVKQEHRFSDKNAFHNLVQAGNRAIQLDNIDELRGVMSQLCDIRIYAQSTEVDMEYINII